MDASGKVQSRFALQKMMQIIKLPSWFGCFFDEARMTSLFADLQKEDEEFLSSFSSKVSRSFTPNEREMSKDNFDPENKEGPREADEKEDLCGDLSTVHDHLHLFEEDLESSVRVFSLGHFEKGECPVPSACGRGQGIFHYPPPPTWVGKEGKYHCPGPPASSPLESGQRIDQFMRDRAPPWHGYAHIWVAGYGLCDLSYGCSHGDPLWQVSLCGQHCVV